MRSDVNIGTALSGGIDSSSIVCAMRYLKPNIDIHTFTYVAEGSKLNEEKWADKINKYVHAISHKIKINPLGITDEIDDLIESQGTPFASTSTYAQYKVFEKIKKKKLKLFLMDKVRMKFLLVIQFTLVQRIKSLLKNREFLGL